MAYITFQPNDYFNTKLYTGNTAGQSITGIGFKPDFSWFKGRVGGGFDHSLRDVLRGSLKHISSNSTAAESDSANSVSSFDTDGFTLGTDNRSFVNENGTTYVSWNWKANGAGSSNTDGSITSTVSASTTSGFSVVKWTGSGGNATIGTGLNAVPKMIIVKSLANTTSWMVYHSAIGNNSEIYLNGTNAAAGSSTAWQDTDPTSSVFYVAGGAGDGVNASGDYVAYCFAEKKGFSKFGSYTGNGNNDGSFIYLGFKPAFFLIKRTDTTESWIMTDNKRGTNNDWNYLLADTSAAEVDGDLPYEFLSNGVKMRGTTQNGSGNTFVYMAFAEEPLVSSNGVPATAR